MTEQHPADRPGHLDIDAVSAFVDRDLGPDDLTTIEIHLRECPACHREILEIRTTVILLAGLPQYTPRRSFCLGHEHARAGRRRGRAAAGRGWPDLVAPASSAASAAAADTAGGRGAGWLPGLQVMAAVVGAMLLMVTSADLFGVPAQPAAWLSGSSAPTRPPESLSAPSAPESEQPAPPPAMEADTDALEPAAFQPEPSFRTASNQSEGTAGGDSASEEVLTAAEAPAAVPSLATMAVTQAMPTSSAGRARGAASEEAAQPAAEQPATSGDQPSRLRVAQLVLAFALAWLIVTIAGLRWVRGPRRAAS